MGRGGSTTTTPQASHTVRRDPGFSSTLEAMAGAAGPCSFARSERVAPHSAQLSPIAEIRNMISPQLNASKSPAVDANNPKILFFALKQYFEQPESRSVKHNAAGVAGQNQHLGSSSVANEADVDEPCSENRTD